MSHQTVEHQGQTIGSVPPVAERPIFLKLGGSLITDKRQMEAVRPELIAQLAAEIAETRRQHPALQLVIGHGSGSFGHVHAAAWHSCRCGKRKRVDGLRSNRRWRRGSIALSWQRYWRPVYRLGDFNPERCYGPSKGPLRRDLQTTLVALQRGLVPVLYGDVLLDEARGGTIASTEEIFEWLLPVLHPQRIVLAGEVDGIYSADPLVDPTATRIAVVTPARLGTIQHGLGGSHWDRCHGRHGGQGATSRGHD
ncbi:MAG: hypothetical protein R2932_09010 [Caldilineaceae bacterium]